MKSISEAMRHYAEMAVQFGKNFYEIDLDYSEKSLEDVDRIIFQYRSGQIFKPGELSEEQEQDLWVFSKMFGGYVGEVILRTLGGAWQAMKADEENLSIELIAGGSLSGSPPELVWRALTEPFVSISAYYKEAKAILNGDDSPGNA